MIISWPVQVVEYQARPGIGAAGNWRHPGLVSTGATVVTEVVAVSVGVVSLSAGVSLQATTVTMRHEVTSLSFDRHEEV